MLKRLFLSLLLGGFLAFAPAALASAHILRTDNGVSIELHIEPDDHPIAGQSTTYLLELQKAPANFNLNNCDCTVAFLQNGVTAATQQIAPTQTDTSTNHFTFPKSGAYTLRLSGKPRQGGDFTPFGMTYPAYVYAPNKQSLNPVTWIVGGAVVLIVIIAAVIMEHGGKRKHPNRSQG